MSTDVEMRKVGSRQRAHIKLASAQRDRRYRGWCRRR